MKLPTIVAGFAIAAVACSSGGGDSSPAPSPDVSGDEIEPTAAAQADLLESTLLDRIEQYPTHNDAASGFGAILGTPDLGVGVNRVAIVLTDNDVGIVRTPFSRVESYYVGEGGSPDQPVESVTAQFFDFPLRVRGLYVTTLNLDRAGSWELAITIPDPESGERVGIRFPVHVEPKAKSVLLGQHVPPTANRTLNDVDSIFELTTSSDPDPGLYDRTVDELVSSGRPFIVTFASPAFCTNALCGPQVEMLSELSAEYGEAAEFVHIDLYENPDQIKGDLSRAQRTPILEDWGVHTDEWTFLVDGDGKVVAKFEAFVPKEELSGAIEKYLIPDA